MEFTKEQRKIIDKLLKESDEEQRKNGNTTYTTEEVIQELFKERTRLIKKIQKEKSILGEKYR